MFYHRDLAWIHQQGFSDWARKAGQYLLAAEFPRVVPSGGLVVDLGCGDGSWAGMLLDAGYRVMGVDLSPDMIQLARRHAPGGQYRVGSMFDVDVPRCHAVTALGEPINYAFAGSRSRLFRRIFRALSPGGLFVFDFAQPGGTPREGRRGYSMGEGWAVLFDSHENSGTACLTRRIVTFRQAGKLWRRTEEVHQQQLFSGVALAGELRQIGFQVRLRRGYGEFRLPGNRAVILARKTR